MRNGGSNHIIKYSVIAGNALYILWIIYNGIDSGFSGRPVEVVALLGLLVLLTLNSILVARKCSVEPLD